MRRELGMIVALAVLCTILAISNSAFTGQGNVVPVITQISMLGILAIGIGFVIITGGIDLSIGSIVGLTGVIIAKLAIAKDDHELALGWPLWLAIIIAVSVACMIGLIQGLLITRLKLQPFIVTLGGMLLIKGISQTITQGGSMSISNTRLSKLVNSGLWVHTFNHNPFPWIPYPLIIFVAVAVLAIYLLHFTVFGRYLFAIGGNRDASEYSGINVRKVETFTYVISAFLASIAGICFASYAKSMDQRLGESFELFAITAAVLGGCSLRGGEGSIVGIIIGTIVMRIIQNGIDMFQIKHSDGSTWKLDQNWKNIIIGATILIAVITDQLTHIVQSRRRTKSAVEKPARTPEPAKTAA